MRRFVIIVAAGTGLRMESSVPKQFMLLGDKPLLMHTIKAFQNCNASKIIVVIPTSFISYWNSLCTQYSFDVEHSVVAGGLFRSQSVKNGLDSIDADDALVAVHDGVRPFVSTELISKAFSLALESGSAVPYVDLVNTIRVIEGKVNRMVERDNYKSVQTPQCYRLSILRKVYNDENLRSFTDDSGLVDKLDFPINLFKGEEENIKITTPLDFMLAEAILRSKQEIY